MKSVPAEYYSTFFDSAAHSFIPFYDSHSLKNCVMTLISNLPALPQLGEIIYSCS